MAGPLTADLVRAAVAQVVDHLRAQPGGCQVPHLPGGACPEAVLRAYLEATAPPDAGTAPLRPVGEVLRC